MRRRRLAAPCPASKEIPVGRFLLGVVVTLLVLAAAGFAVVFTGGYDVAATSPHTQPVYWALDTTRVNAIHRMAADVRAPGSLTDEQARRGYKTYSEACVYCHGAPGADPEPWSAGMLPEPPYMPDVAKNWSDGEIFWIVKHGIKMSGMPAFKLSDEQIWDVVAFVRRIPDMSEDAYKAYGEAPAGGGGAGAGA